MTLVDTYPELFRRYFGSALEPVGAASYASPGGRPYELIDVSERLEEALPGPP